MKISNPKKLSQKDLIVFDMDGTLTETKSPMDRQMSDLMTRLLQVKKVAIIGGGKYALFQEQFLQELRTPKDLLNNLFLFPTTSTAFYRYNKGWKNVYTHKLNSKQKNQIRKAFQAAFKEIGYKHPDKTYGQLIEDRGTQFSFSALGQDVVKILGKKGIALKEKWLKENKELKMKIARLVGKRLPGMEVRAAGFTTIDVTKKGIDKAYGIHQIEKQLKVPIRKMLFIGDAIFPGGNDYAVVRTGVDYMPVKGPEETKKILRQILQK